MNLAGQTSNLYLLFDPRDQTDTLVNPAEAGYADAAAYLNAHGGICGAVISHVFPDGTQNMGPPSRLLPSATAIRRCM